MIVDVAETRVRIEVPAPLERELRTQLADLAAPVDRDDPTDRSLTLRCDAGGSLELTDGSSVVRSGIDPAVAIGTVVWRLNAIAATSANHLAVHAAVVGGRGAVLLPGRSGAGKSTLTAACIRAGMRYLSDELALLDLDQGLLVPYPKPIGLADERLVAASTVSVGAPAPPLRPSALVFPQFQATASTRLTRLDACWTLTALAGHSPNLAALGATALPTLAALAESVPAWQVTYGDTAAGLAAVTDAADRAPVELTPLTPFSRVTPTTTTVPIGEGLAVYDEAGGELHVLDASASKVWLAIPRAHSESELVTVVRTMAPAASPDHISDTLAHLERCGLLTGGPLTTAQHD